MRFNTVNASVAFIFIILCTNSLYGADAIGAPGSKLAPVTENKVITEADVTVDRVGTSIPVSAIGEPVSAVRPVGRFRRLYKYGARMMIPKNPRTTDGNPPRISINGFNISRNQRGDISAIKIAVPNPNGTAKRVAPTVTMNEPPISNATSIMAGKPSFNRKRKIMVTKMMAE